MPSSRTNVWKKTNIVLMLVFLYGANQTLLAQDSTSVAKHSAKDFGLMFGASWVQVQVGSTDYVNPSTQQVVTASGTSQGGLSIGMFYNVALTPKWMIRPSVEAHLTNTSVRYNVGKNTESYSVYPVCVEVPISVVYGLNQRMPIEQNGWKGIGILGAVRPIVPVSLFNSSYPVTNIFSINAELGISLPKALRNTIWRTELLVSYNVLRINKAGEANDFRSNMIDDMRRHFVGLRFYFN